jgi:hypothetical protein
MMQGEPLKKMGCHETAQPLQTRKVQLTTRRNFWVRFISKKQNIILKSQAGGSTVGKIKWTQ